MIPRDAYGSRSILTRGRAYLVVGVRTAQETLSLDEVVQAFAKGGAFIERRDESGFECSLPLRKFLKVGYRRRLSLPCRVETRTEAKFPEPNLLALCDVKDIRKQQRFNFYFLSIFAFLLVLPRLFDAWDITALFFLFLPWPIAEIAYFVDQARLRSKLIKFLKSATPREL